MKIKLLHVIALAILLALPGCSWLKSKNKLENHSLSEFGQKRAQTVADETGEGTASELGIESKFSMGEAGGILSGMNGKTEDDVRADKLFAGALDVVLELPITTASRLGGFISTDWKTNPNDNSIRYRLNIRISGQKPYGLVRVAVLKQKRDNGQWVDQPGDADLAANIAKAIRKRARVARPKGF